MKPQRSVPWDEERECDCSGFAMWCLGLSRYDADTGLWYDSSRIFHEANAGSAYFTRIEWRAALPGDLLVYPDRTGTDGVRWHGHVAIVTEVTPGRGPYLIVDCSSSNYRRITDAIREGPPDHFIGNDFAIVASYVRLSAVLA
jgi:hypothetical protein